MHIETLKTFCDLVETGSFSKAAALNFTAGPFTGEIGIIHHRASSGIIGHHRASSGIIAAMSSAPPRAS